ncbi:MAG: site-specific DNA-methyltransferase [Lachnospirales bacterium]
MIYIDPPYNTGKDFIYPDNFTDSLANYKEITSQATKSNPETMGRFHTDWLNMIYPRLRLAYNLLKDDGVIFISIDDNEVHNLRKVCDEVFGEENFVAQISWKRKKEISNDSKNIAIQGEYILSYQKTEKSILKFEPLSKEYIEKSYKEPTNMFPKGKWRPVPLTVSKGLSGGGYEYTIETPSGEKHDKLWAYPENSYKKLLEEGLVYFGVNNDAIPQRVMYADDSKGQPTSNFWDNVATNKEGKKDILDIFSDNYFDTPKPSNLIKKMLLLATDSNDIILDFFSGSATTAHAVMDLNAIDGGNRKFILVQLPELCEENTEAYKNGYKNICEIGKERIRRAGSKIEEEINQYKQQLKLDEAPKPMVDTGFKVFKLDTSNVKIWDNTSFEKIDTETQVDLFTKRLNSMVETVKGDRTDLDIVYEVLLKLGLELTESITPYDFLGKQGYIIREDALLIICLEKDVKAENVEAMAEFTPATIVFAEDSFSTVQEIENAKVKVDEILGVEHGDKIKFRFV